MQGVTLLVILLLSMSASMDERVADPNPNDPWFPAQIALHGQAADTATLPRRSQVPRPMEVFVRSDALPDFPAAWRITTGSHDVIVALLDDGFFYRHEDLSGNLWENPGETGTDQDGFDRRTNRVDDDGNGFVDDVVGWDFAFDDPDPDPYVFDGMDRSRIQPYSHSISAMGIIGARGNNGLGVAGTNWNVSLMLLKIGAQGIRRNEKDEQRAQRAARAIRYAADNGARIINWSGFLGGATTADVAVLRESVRYAAERRVLLVTAAGNDGLDIDQDANCLYPQCLDEENILVVAEAEFDGSLVVYETGGERRGSNYGRRRVDVAAIAQVFTTELQDGSSVYGVSGGTSNACPVVAGLAALMLSVNPKLSPAEIRKIIVETATPIDELEDTIAAGGVIHAGRAVARASGDGESGSEP